MRHGRPGYEGGGVNGTNKLFCELPRNSLNRPATTVEAGVPPRRPRTRDRDWRGEGWCCQNARGGCGRGANLTVSRGVSAPARLEKLERKKLEPILRQLKLLTIFD